ncbi:ATP-binding cassette domain-containing protein [Paenarthrobacter histidinolovorans]|uniref:ATP-binding cassette domain-containing protein n=1 Tax=Paenarthrobacter histidinolovorans TaxID=43664 RepID=UPI001E51563E|nr:ATP-binding cassette domain-containing protein [Paenarthrobacter histidinolovorans]
MGIVHGARPWLEPLADRVVAEVQARVAATAVISGLGVALLAWVVALIGLNGAGKISLMRIALGIIRPQAGSVRMCGQPLADLPPASGLRWEP